eukprot:2389642-Rhodomonas_salina.1
MALPTTVLTCGYGATGGDDVSVLFSRDATPQDVQSGQVADQFDGSYAVTYAITRAGDPLH